MAEPTRAAVPCCSGLEIRKTAITIRRVERFVIRYGSDAEREVRVPGGLPPYSAAVAFEFGW